jgi:hypothetical protein
VSKTAAPLSGNLRALARGGARVPHRAGKTTAAERGRTTMTGFNDRLRGKLPAGRSPSTDEYRKVMDYVEFVLALCEKDMPRVLPEYAGDWYHTLILALQVTILLREGKLTRGPVLAKYGMARRENWVAYADHYLQMRADAFNLGPAGLPTLQSAVFDYDLAKALGIAPQTGSEQVSPATDLSIFWGLQGIEDGLADDKLDPRSSGSPRYVRNAVYEEMTFALTGMADAIVGAMEIAAHKVGPNYGMSWRR